MDLKVTSSYLIKKNTWGGCGTTKCLFRWLQLDCLSFNPFLGFGAWGQE